MTTSAIVILCICIVFLTLAIEAGIQDRIRYNDSTWFAWAKRNIRHINADRKKNVRTIKSTK